MAGQPLLLPAALEVGSDWMLACPRVCASARRGCAVVVLPKLDTVLPRQLVPVLAIRLQQSTRSDKPPAWATLGGSTITRSAALDDLAGGTGCLDGGHQQRLHAFFAGEGLYGFFSQVAATALRWQ